jgi:hypothetical protein
MESMSDRKTVGGSAVDDLRLRQLLPEPRDEKMRLPRMSVRCLLGPSESGFLQCCTVEGVSNGFSRSCE